MIVNRKFPPNSCVAPTGEQWSDIRTRLMTKRTKVLTFDDVDEETFEDKFPSMDPQRIDFEL